MKIELKKKENLKSLKTLSNKKNNKRNISNQVIYPNIIAMVSRHVHHISNEDKKITQNKSKKTVVLILKDILKNFFSSKLIIIIILIFLVIFFSIFLMGCLGMEMISFAKVQADICTWIFKKRYPSQFGLPWSFKVEQLFWFFDSKTNTESILKNLDFLCLQAWHMEYNSNFKLYLQTILFLYIAIWDAGWKLWCFQYGIGIGKKIINLIFLKLVLQIPIILEVTQFLARSNPDLSLSQLKECILFSFRNNKLWGDLITCCADSVERIKIVENSTHILEPFITGQQILDLSANLDPLIALIPHIILITYFKGTSLFPDYLFIYRLVPVDYTFLDLPLYHLHLFNSYNIFC